MEIHWKLGANDFSEITLITAELKAVGEKKNWVWEAEGLRLFLFHEAGDKSGKTERHLHPRRSLCASFRSAGDNAGLKHAAAPTVAERGNNVRREGVASREA